MITSNMPYNYEPKKKGLCPVCKLVFMDWRSHLFLVHDKVIGKKYKYDKETGSFSKRSKRKN